MATAHINNFLDSTLESPFYEKDGLLEFKEGFTDPEFFSKWSFVTKLYGEKVFIDHCVLTFPNYKSLENYASGLGCYGNKIVEGPGLFPIDFCPNGYNIKTDLWIYLLTMLMPAGGLVVLDAPHAPGDQKDRFIQQRGLAGVHHAAIRVEDVRAAALVWQKKGFRPLSLEPLDGDSLCQWFLQNSAGQIIELISRSPDNNATFYCQNIGGLRCSELS
jgi:hypothetical protein